MKRAEFQPELGLPTQRGGVLMEGLEPRRVVTPRLQVQAGQKAMPSSLPFSEAVPEETDKTGETGSPTHSTRQAGRLA